MPRKPRLIEEKFPHHITQRGNRRETLFFDADDRILYKKLLKRYALVHQVEILAYCLMTNHIHLIVVPETKKGLIRLMNTTQMMYSVQINRKRGTCGHSWNSRYFCSPLDEGYMWAALRYVELNPVRAGIVNFAEEYPWSSAKAHCFSYLDDLLLTTHKRWLEILSARKNWGEWLRENKKDDKKLEFFRKQLYQDLPCGSEQFISFLEEKSGRKLRYVPRGRPVKTI